MFNIADNGGIDWMGGSLNGNLTGVNWYGGSFKGGTLLHVTWRGGTRIVMERMVAESVNTDGLKRIKLSN